MVFAAVIDTAIGVSTMMLVALGDKPARRARTVSAHVGPLQQRVQGANTKVSPHARTQTVAQAPVLSYPERAPTSPPAVRGPVASAQGSAHTTAQANDLDLASLAGDLIESGATTQPVETVITVLSSHRGGASINAAARRSGINYRTAQRIVAGAAEHRQRQLTAVG